MRKAALILISILFIVIPLFQKAVLTTSVVLIFLSALSFIHQKKRIEWFWIILLGTGLFISFSLSLFWTENMEEGWLSLGKKLSLVAIPISLSLIGPFDKKENKFLWMTFIAGLLISAGWYLSRALCHSFYEIDYSAFFYARLSNTYHPSYLAMYFVIGIVVLSFSKFSLIGKYDKLLKTVLISLFTAFVVLLSSKAGLLCAALVLAFTFLIRLFSSDKLKAIPSLAGLAIFMMMYNCTGFAKSRVETSVSAENQEQTSTKSTYRNSVDSRLIAWKGSLEIILENPNGVGVGDSQDELASYYQINGETHLLKKHLNSHNQFLTNGLHSGFIGVGLLCLLFLFLIIRAVNQKDWMLAMMILVIGINLMTESMFERACGTVFIPLVLSLHLFRTED